MEFKSYDEDAEDEWGGLMDVIAARKRDAESDTRPPGQYHSCVHIRSDGVLLFKELSI